MDQLCQWFSRSVVHLFSGTIVQWISWVSGSIDQRYMGFSGSVGTWFNRSVVRWFSGAIAQRIGSVSGLMDQWYIDSVVQ